jgi:endothelin-converting enzyme/putative endopeptidase
MTIAELQKMTPAINWKTILQVLVLHVTFHNKIHEALQTILSENNVSAWKEYMKWTLLNGSTGLFSTTVDAANFDFYGRDINNQSNKDHLKTELCKQLMAPSVKL